MSKVLILTDHTSHSSENSLYELAKAMERSNRSQIVHVASRKLDLNRNFFNGLEKENLYVSEVDQSFHFDKKNHTLEDPSLKVDVNIYDLIWLRLPPPLDARFINFLSNFEEQQMIINDPRGIKLTGSKSFLLNFKDWSAPMKLCQNVDDIRMFKSLFPIVLKPLRGYGGEGIVRIEDEVVQCGDKRQDFNTFIEHLPHNFSFLGVKYLKNVNQGDKRIVVVNGEILGASLRLPAEGSWLCNVSRGGSSNATNISSRERQMIKAIDPVLQKLGIVMYGVDTLVDDDGNRVLSEINTTSIGGLTQIAKFENKLLLDRAIELIWQNYDEKKLGN